MTLPVDNEGIGKITRIKILMDFSVLFRRYLANQASPHEEEAMWSMIATGLYEEQIKEIIDETKPETAALDQDKAREMRQYIFAQREPVKRGRAVHMKRRTWGWIGIAAAILILMVSLVWVYTPGYDTSLSDRQEEVVPRNFTGRQFVKLPDGTTVLLNDGSRLTYSGAFGNGTREVELSGEGYFDVTHDPSNPFIVRTGKVRTTVLGTAFNVKAYSGRQEVVVTVTRGKVAVGDDKREYEQLLPEEQLAVNTETNRFEKTKPAIDQALAWQSEFLILDEVSMQKAAEVIGERFNTTVTIKNESLKNCIIKATFLNGESVQHVIASIALVMEADYRLEDGKFIIEGGKVCH